MKGSRRMSLHKTGRFRSMNCQIERLEPRRLLSAGGPFAILSVNPPNGSVVPYLLDGAPTLPPSIGEIVVTLSEPVAGLTDGASPIQSSGTFNPYDVMLIPRGPSGVFQAPSAINGGDFPLRASVVYHVNADGTSEFVITPADPLASDVYLVSIDLAAFKNATGNTLTDVNNGYSTFLLDPTEDTVFSQPLAVTNVTESNGQTTIDNNVVSMPDTIQIQFNRALYAGAAQGNNVQLIANPGPNFTVVPSVAVYNPNTDSIDLTPAAILTPGTVYAVRVAGKDSGSGYVSDDQGDGGPGNPLPNTFYDTFEVSGLARVPSSPMQVSALLPNPSTTPEPTNDFAVQFTEPLDFSSLGPFSAMVIPSAGGLGTTDFGPGTAPLNSVVAYNPNTWQLIIVPTQVFRTDTYLVALSGMKATNGDPLLNDAGQPAGVNGNAPYYALLPLMFAEPVVAAVPDHAGTAPAQVVLATIADPDATSSSRSQSLVPTGPQDAAGGASL